MQKLIRLALTAAVAVAIVVRLRRRTRTPEPPQPPPSGALNGAGAVVAAVAGLLAGLALIGPDLWPGHP